MKFFKTVLAVIVGCFCFFFISLLFFILIASFFAPKEDSLEIKEHSILSLDFQKEVYEYSNPIHIKDFDFDMQQENTLTAVLRAIKEAKTDSNIQGIVLGSTQGVKGRAHLQNIREAVEDFKASGKFVYALAKGRPNRTIYYKVWPTLFSWVPFPKYLFRDLAQKYSITRTCRRRPVSIWRFSATVSTKVL